jgi:hypothetical protein
MISPLKDFEISAASERGLNLDPDFTRFECPRDDFMDAHIFLAVQNRGFHDRRLWRQPEAIKSKILQDNSGYRLPRCAVHRGWA